MPDSADIISIVALVISITSFVVAVAQAIQQYVTSAEGYRKCAKSVMGQWSERTRRKFMWKEVRFEVRFETPVFFVANPNNDKGPIPNRPIHNIDGTAKSYKESLTLQPAEQQAEDFRPVHTADDERATWVTLLATLQRSERESRKWDEDQSITPKGTKYQRDPRPLGVQIQMRKRSWDFMPDTVLRPYATTTISHLAEIVVMLGMTWRAFDPDSWNLRAEGNGFILISSLVPGFGLMVSFAVTGKNMFTSQHTIPCKEIPELVFGSVPTVFEKLELNFGEEYDIRRTLQRVGCKQDTMDNYFQRRDHVHPVSFELIAMIGKTFRIRGSNFKMIPNPTQDIWNETFSARAMIQEFQRKVTLLAETVSISQQALSIVKTLRKLEATWGDTEAPLDIDMLETIHDCIDSCTAFLVQTGEVAVVSVVGAHFQNVLDQLNDPESFLSSRDCDTEAEVMEHYFDHVRPAIASAMSTKEAGQLAGSSQDKLKLREDIWITLLCRMCCWYLLHEYRASDTMILPPRLKKSRLPVFIA